jgi:probable DNA repair protein
LRPSPLIAELPANLDGLAPSLAPQDAIRAVGVAIERVRDEVGPVRSTAAPALGGTAVLRDQALCPFRAFGHHRLAAQAFGRPVPGIDPITRGTLVHAVLALFWTLTGSHSAFCALDEDQRRERIRSCVTSALASQYSRFPPAPPAAMLAIERNRLELLLEDWLMTVEWNRPAFDLVATEHECEDVFGGLRIRTKVDRIDILPDGGKVIIDYKTGRVALDDLVSEQLLEPQLPIYAIGAGSEGLAGVAIGQLRRGECTLRGIARDEGLLPKISAFSGSKLATRHGLANWNELLVRWQTRLEELGRDFMAGQAGVSPVSLEKACRTCDLAPLCRIGEAADSPADGEVAT